MTLRRIDNDFTGMSSKLGQEHNNQVTAVNCYFTGMITEIG